MVIVEANLSARFDMHCAPEAFLSYTFRYSYVAEPLFSHLSTAEIHRDAQNSFIQYLGSDAEGTT